MYQDYGFYPYQNYQPFPNRMSHGLAGLFRRGSQQGFANVGGIRPKFDWGNFLSNTQKTLNVVNQAIPIFYQIKPIWNNAKTMFRIMGALKEDDEIENKTSNKNSGFSPTNETTSPAADHTHSLQEENQPRFFL